MMKPRAKFVPRSVTQMEKNGFLETEFFFDIAESIFEITVYSPKLYSSFTHVKYKKTETTKQHDGKLFPVSKNTIPLPCLSVLIDHMFTSKNKPECHKGGIKNSLNKKDNI